MPWLCWKRQESLWYGVSLWVSSCLRECCVSSQESRVARPVAVLPLLIEVSPTRHEEDKPLHLASVGRRMPCTSHWGLALIHIFLLTSFFSHPSQVLQRRVNRSDKLALAHSQLDVLEKALDEQKV